MSKKHFEALAAKFNGRLTSLRNSNDLSDSERDMALTATENSARDVAGVCADANPHFDTHRFLTACGIN
jgi:hypothetical protein